MATTKKTAAPAKPAAELRVYLTLTDLQPQFSSWMSSPLGARGYVAMQGTNALLVEIAPGLSIQRVIDLALKAEPTLEPGILAVERQFGVLELHSNDSAALQRAGHALRLPTLDAGTAADWLAAAVRAWAAQWHDAQAKRGPPQQPPRSCPANAEPDQSSFLRNAGM